MIYALGFSVRALAQATRAAGFEVFALDSFGDKDLLECAINHRKVDWNGWIKDDCTRSIVAGKPQLISENPSPQAFLSPAILRAISSDSREAYLLLAGGVENWAPVLDQLHNISHVLGPTAAQMLQLRSPHFWRECGQVCSGIHFPDSCFLDASLAKDDYQEAPGSGEATRSWLLKAPTSAGGLGVRGIPKGEAKAVAEQMVDEYPQSYLQERIQGASIGVTLVLPPEPANCKLIGATESWDSEDWSGPTEFIYRGSWGPVQLREPERTSLLQLADYIRSRVGAIGWLQIDLIRSREGRLWLLEMNPRWAAGMEILARAGLQPVKHHLESWGIPSVRASKQKVSAPGYHAKAVLYAPVWLQLSAEQIQAIHRLPRDRFADLPNIEPTETQIQIEAGHPVLTVLASQRSSSVEARTVREQLRRQLQNNAHRVLAIMNITR